VVRLSAPAARCPRPSIRTGESSLEGTTAAFSLRSILDFLTNSHAEGRLTWSKDGTAQVCRFRRTATGGVLTGRSRRTGLRRCSLRSLRTSGRSSRSRWASTRMHQCRASCGYWKRACPTRTRLRALLRSPGRRAHVSRPPRDPGRFSFEPRASLPPMFQAFPLQQSSRPSPSKGPGGVPRLTTSPACFSLHFARHGARAAMWTGRAWDP